MPSWQADHALLRERGWRRGADKLWRCDEFGGSFLTRNALAIERTSAIPYPPVFHDWQYPERRVATARDIAGVRVETLLPDGSRAWIDVVLTEEDASLMAASLLMRAGHVRLAKRVLVGLARAAGRS
jgi:hypothetical protein